MSQKELGFLLKDWKKSTHLRKKVLLQFDSCQKDYKNREKIYLWNRTDTICNFLLTKLKKIKFFP